VIEASSYRGRGMPERIRQLMTSDVFLHPGDTTRLLLSSYNLAHHSLLDVGCGPNPELAYDMHVRGCEYSGIDINPAMIEAFGKQAGDLRIPYEDVRLGDARHIPFTDGFNFTHMRFVLAHMPPSDWQRAIIETIRCCTRCAFFLEYDWGVMSASGAEDARVLGRFIDLSRRLAKYLGLNLDMGTGLYNQVLESALMFGADAQEQRHLRPEDDYTNELLYFTQIGIVLAAQHDLADIAHGMARVQDMLLERPIHFVPMQIVSVTVTV
jgi:ubiquinone/menaquinone biosynthesis C-methylase UbiE